MRRLAVAASLLSVGACCVDVAPDDACVVEQLGARPYCYPIVNEDVVCTWSGEEPELPPLVEDYRSCEGRTHSGEDCTDLGFPSRCDGGFHVRAGDPCR